MGTDPNGLNLPVPTLEKQSARSDQVIESFEIGSIRQVRLGCFNLGETICQVRPDY